jgi:hypothetical protein
MAAHDMIVPHRRKKRLDTMMKQHVRRSLFVAATALLGLAISAGQPEPKFTLLFPEDGPVTKGWVVRTWANIKDAPQWKTIWEVRKGILYGGKSATGKWVGTWLLSEREYGDFILEVDFKFLHGGATGNGGVALRTPLAGRPSYHGMELQITDLAMSFLSTGTEHPTNSPAPSTKYSRRLSRFITRENGITTA